MSVLRKQSPWVIPVASLLGALSLGLAGCGGGDDTPFPPGGGGLNNPIAITAPAPAVAQVVRPLTRGQGQTLDVTQPDNANTGRVTGLNIIIPGGVVGGDATFGAAILPNLIVQGNQILRQNGAPVAEFAFGPVNPLDNTIQPFQPSVVNGNVPVDLTFAPGVLGGFANNGTFDLFELAQEGGNQTFIRRAHGGEEGRHCVVNRANNTVRCNTNRSGRYVVIFVPQHGQGNL